MSDGTAWTHPMWQWCRRHAFAALWLAYALFFLANAAANTAVVSMDYARLGRDIAPWQAPLWEWSSAVVLALAAPMVIWAEQRFPLAWGRLAPHLAFHLAWSVAFSLVHVAGMVAVREAVYAAMAQEYDFGHWGTELAYEYLKDVRAYALLLLSTHYLRLLLRRSQGEAHLLDGRDDVEPAPADADERFLVRKLGREFLVPASEIEYAVAAGNYVNLHVRGKDYPLRITVAALEARLPADRFQRIHRSAIVNLDEVARVDPLEGGEAKVAMRDGTQLSCSRRYRARLRERHRGTA